MEVRLGMGMIELKGFPLRDQLRDIASEDGKPAENASYDCVPASIAAGIQYLTGRVVSADALKDAVYGQGYVGGGAARSYVHEVARYGVALTVRSGSSQAQLIAILRDELRRGHPALITMPSHWSVAPADPLHPGPSHVGIVYAIDESDSGQMAVMNPWHGFRHIQPIAWWRARLCYGQVWPMARINEAASAVTQLPGGWTDDAAAGVLRGANGVPVVRGFRDYVLARVKARTWQGGYAYEPEWSGAGMSIQPFAAALLLWTPDRGVYEGTMADALAIIAHQHEGKAA